MRAWGGIAVVLVAACGGPSKPADVIIVAEDAGPTTPIATTPVRTPPPPPAEDPPKQKASGPAAPPIGLASLTTSGQLEITRGKVVVVHFWATWCEPCKRSFPKLQALFAKQQQNGLEIAGVSVDDDQTDVAAFAKRFGAKFPVGWDDGHRVSGQYKVESMPSTYIVDKDGVIRFVHQGYHDGEEAEIEREVRSLL
jgi:peroxiredoxin